MAEFFSHPRLGETRPHLRGFTLVEMLVAMAITLVMMAAVVTLFANVSGSVRNRRATAEMSGQVRHVRNVLQQDLQGATCPGLTWQRPDSNHGYIELIEGQYRDSNPSQLVDAIDETSKFNWEIDHTTSIIPSSNLPLNDPSWVTDGGGLGDYDDILMLTVRNEHEPFVGRMPAVTDNAQRTLRFVEWGSETIESPLAEVVWFAIENPTESERAENFFGEPGMRTIYRRTLLIAPWVNPYLRAVDNSGLFREPAGGGRFKPEPGLVRILPEDISIEQAIAAIIAFQDRYDLSVRLEWDHNIERWKIMANTLGDLTKRENRFGHFALLPASGGNNSGTRTYPYALVSIGSGYSGSNAGVAFVSDPEIGPPGDDAVAAANIQDAPPPGTLKGLVVSYTNQPANFTDSNRRYAVRPFAYVDDTPTGGVPATANAILNDEGQVVRVVHGPVPLWGGRRGQDVMLTSALAFDLRVYDPGAPLYSEPTMQTVLQPSDPGWKSGYAQQLGTAAAGFSFVGQGAYVDMGFAFGAATPPFAVVSGSWTLPWFAEARGVFHVNTNQLLTPGYAMYDTWSFHYENNGVNEDEDETINGAWRRVVSPPDPNAIPSIDEGTNGLDDWGHYADGTQIRLGVDDVGERETVPPYDKPLRGVQVLMRVYEPDSRAIRQVRVNQHFMPE